MSDHSAPPPSYQLSQQGRDEKIPEKFQELILSRISSQDLEEERDGDDSKDSKEPEKQEFFFQTPVQPLHIRKRTPRGARPLPPNPADQARSRPPAITLAGPLSKEPEPQDHQVMFSPPPPFTAVGSSLDGPPYERSMYHTGASATPPSLSPPCRGQQRPSSSYTPIQPHADPYRRTSHNPYLEPSSSSSLENIPTVSRVKFDPSIAYGTSSNPMHNIWESDSTSADGVSLYSSAVSSYLQPASARKPGPRSSYISTKNRYSTLPRPSSTSSALTPAGGPVVPPLQFHPSHTPEFSASYQSLPRPNSNQGYHVRWATSEADFTRDIYP